MGSKNREMRAIIFDMDGVLIDTESHHLRIEKKIFEELGLDISDEDRKPFIGMASDELWALVVKKYGLEISSGDLLKLNNQRIIDHFSDGKSLKPIPGIYRVLEWIVTHKIPLAVASSSSIEVINSLLESTGLDSYFNIRVGGQSVEKSKPEPFIYLHTAKLLGFHPSDCLAIEDSYNGITAAKSAGLYCVGYNGIGYHGQNQSHADIVIGQFDQLIPILEDFFS